MDETPEQRIEQAAILCATHAFNPNRAQRKYTHELSHSCHTMRHFSHTMLTESLIFPEAE
jgi:hypothetical protein